MPKKKAPKARSRGTIESRGSGKFLVRVFAGVDERTGKRLYPSKTVTGTRKDAEKELTRMLRESDTGAAVVPSKARLGAYLDSWLKEKRGITSNTRNGYERDIARIKPIIGNVPLGKLKKEDVQHLYDTLLADGFAPKTLVRIHATLRQALKTAQEAGIISRNPQAGTKRPKVQETEVSILLPDQVDRLLVTTEGTMWGTIWMIALTTGLRPQELAGLRWEDYDGEGLSIQRALIHDMETRKWVIGDVKTKKSRRYVHLAAGAISRLNAYRTQQKRAILAGKIRGGNPEGYIFVNTRGNLLTTPDMGRRWRAALKKADLPPARLYDARHSHATHLLLAGKSPKVVSARLGHSTTGITMDVYSHVLKTMEADAADTIDDMIFHRPKEQTA